MGQGDGLLMGQGAGSAMGQEDGSAMDQEDGSVGKGASYRSLVIQVPSLEPT